MAGRAGGDAENRSGFMDKWIIAHFDMRSSYTWGVVTLTGAFHV